MRLVIILIALLLGSDVAHAQDLVVRGRVLGPDNAALDSQRVVLHRVATDAGATIAESVSGPDGAFELSAQLSGDTTALLFVAVRYQGELYIGPPFREADSGMEQVIQVGVPGTSASALIGGTDGTGAATVPRTIGGPVTSRGWLLWAIPLAGVAAVGLYLIVPRPRMPEKRSLLIRVAELDEKMETAAEPQRDALLHERQQLLAQLRSV